MLRHYISQSVTVSLNPKPLISSTQESPTHPTQSFNSLVPPTHYLPNRGPPILPPYPLDAPVPHCSDAPVPSSSVPHCSDAPVPPQFCTSWLRCTCTIQFCTSLFRCTCTIQFCTSVFRCTCTTQLCTSRFRCTCITQFCTSLTLQTSRLHMTLYCTQ